MLPSTQRIDSHVHFYTSDDLRRVAGLLPYVLPEPHPLTAYLDKLIDAGIAPTVINNVHLSILPDSENVFASFDELKKLQAANPLRYGTVRLAGTIKAEPAYATKDRLSHPQVIGARIVLHDARPETVSESDFSDEQWSAFYGRLLPHQHLHIYAKEAETNLRVLRQIPRAVRVIIDHLGTCHSERDITEPAYIALLTEARERGNVWFKGPGYRTSVYPEETARFVTQIVYAVGADKLLLEATDAPHVGTDHQGVPYSELFDLNNAFNFVDAVAQHVSTETRIPVGQLLRGASGQLVIYAHALTSRYPAMTNITTKEINFAVNYGDETLSLNGTVFQPEHIDAALPPVIFNSGFTGGVTMYGQLFGRALAARGYRVMTYDVAGFFSNKHIRNTIQAGDIEITNVILEDQKDEVLGAVEWARENFGEMPVVASWAMGSVASLGAVAELAAAGGEQIRFWVPMSYTNIRKLQTLRADQAAADAAIQQLADDAPIPPFDTGTDATRLGYYPLDPETQAYVDQQLGGYTEAGGADRWPGCTHVTAKSYKSYVAYDPEQSIEGAKGFPPALIIHGAENTLHMPSESVRLHQNYPGDAGSSALIIPSMQHGQQNQVDSPVFKSMIQSIDEAIRARG